MMSAEIERVPSHPRAVAASELGYVSEQYALALAEFGQPTRLERSGGWLLVRPIQDSAAQDAAGCYPFFSCQRWSMLAEDLGALDDQVVSVIMVTDPFGDYSEGLLADCFPHHLLRYKEHYVTDLRRPKTEYVTYHHQRYARKASKVAAVEICADPLHHLPRWLDLYANLIQRHGIRGIARFSSQSFALQFHVPGLVVMTAIIDGSVDGMLLWFVRDDVAYYHLGAYSDLGYRHRVSFALFWQAIDYFREMGLHWLALGAGAGADNLQGQDGLTEFKRGWANGARQTYLGGRICQPHMYANLLKDTETKTHSYFPAYRRGEFS